VKPEVKEIIIVEGKCDINAVKRAVSAVVIETGGFRIFNDCEKRALLRRLAGERGIVVLTDSDNAGTVIRNYLRSVIPEGNIKHAYIPQIAGKERRKTQPSRQGLLGVEAMPEDVILDALRKCGAEINGQSAPSDWEKLTKADMYEMGLSGRADSAEKRACVLKKCGLPASLSANAMLEAVNLIYSKEEFEKLSCEA